MSVHSGLQCQTAVNARRISRELSGRDKGVQGHMNSTGTASTTDVTPPNAPRTNGIAERDGGRIGVVLQRHCRR
ncbi:MAG: hypothetical protein GDA36_02550 [Rhodobacteraceae bacterium]|nr:hypothetical protein [Paracoccaceae bacterium]